MKKQLCNRCKRDLDWEEKEMINNLPREHLIKMVLGFMTQNKLKGGKSK